MHNPEPGMLLIAEPFLRDPNFSRSVVLLCEHKEEGSFGLLLNRSYHQTLEDLIPECEGMDFAISDGGPVQRDTLHFIHQYPERIPGGSELRDGMYWGGDFELAIRLLRSGVIDRDRIRFFIGYSGWTEGQLDSEVREKSWLVTPGSRKIVFPKSEIETWKESLRDMGGEYEILVNFPIDPSMN
jgi:putative transcriptional regulator